MTCEEYRALLDRLLDGEATPADEEAVRQHEAECPDCAALRGEMAGLMDVLGDAEDVPPMPEDLHAQWVQAVREEAVASGGKEKIFSLATFRKQWMRWGATAALAFLVLGGTLLTWDTFDKAKTRRQTVPQPTATIAAAAEETPTPQAKAEGAAEADAAPALYAMTANSLEMAMEEAAPEEPAEQPVEDAVMLAETADAGMAFEEAEAWDMEEASEEAAFKAEREYEPAEAKGTVALSVPSPAATPMPTPEPTPMPTQTPEPAPTFTAAPEPTATPVPAVAKDEPRPEPEQSHPRRWIGWIALIVGGVLALVVLSTKQIREQRKRKNH